MEEGKIQDSWVQYENFVKNKDHFAKCTSSSPSTSSLEDSMISNGSSISSLSDNEDDSASSSNSSRALYDLSEIMAQLPIKRGLSKFYQGKSESFTSLASVTAIEDLAKRATPYTRKVKASTGLNNYKNYTLPKAIISKKSTKGFSSKREGFMRLTPLKKNLQC